MSGAHWRLIVGAVGSPSNAAASFSPNRRISRAVHTDVVEPLASAELAGEGQTSREWPAPQVDHDERIAWAADGKHLAECHGEFCDVTLLVPIRIEQYPVRGR